MIVTSIVSLLLLAQQQQAPALLEVRLFEGGGLADYIGFYSSLKFGRFDAYPEGLAKYYGPARAQRYSDKSVVITPTLDEAFSLRQIGRRRVLAATRLPGPYLGANPLIAPDAIDTITVDSPEVPGKSVSQLRGSFCLRNGLPFLKAKVFIHPFFQPMSLHFENAGGFVDDDLNAIAAVIGAQCRFNPSHTEIYFEPDYAELRRRAVKTLDYVTPRTSVPITTERETLTRWLVEGSSDSEWKSWIDASKTAIELPIRTNEGLSKRVKEYRRRALNYLEKTSPSAFKKFGIEEYENAPLFLKLDRFLSTDIRIQSPDGLDIHI